MSELSRRVADAVGYKVRYPIDQAGHELTALGYELVEPDGHVLRPKLPIFDEDILWGNAPDYEHDPAACIDALCELPVSVTWRLVRLVSPNGQMGYTYKVGLIIHDDGDARQFDIYGATPSEAMCNALLAYYAAPR